MKFSILSEYDQDAFDLFEPDPWFTIVQITYDDFCDWVLTMNLLDDINERLHAAKMMVVA